MGFKCNEGENRLVVSNGSSGQRNLNTLRFATTMPSCTPSQRTSHTTDYSLLFRVGGL